MAVATEGKHAGDFLVDDEGENSRDAAVFTGDTLQAGSVVGRVDRGVGGAVSTYSGTGNGTLTGLRVGLLIQKGAYLIKCKTAAANGGVFSVTAPDGTVLPDATVGTPYVSDHLSFTLNDGSTDFILNDQFTVTVGTTTAVVSGTGNGTISSVALKSQAKKGRYRLVCTAAATNGGTFELHDPDGDVIETQSISGGAGGTATFSQNPQIGLVVTDGSTDFAAADTFEIVVFTDPAGKVRAWDPTVFDGRQIVAGISWDNYDASSADVKGVIEVRMATVNAGELVYKTGFGTAYQAMAKAGLAALGITVRASV